jgi:hypothetical protein
VGTELWQITGPTHEKAAATSYKNAESCGETVRNKGEMVYNGSAFDIQTRSFLAKTLSVSC